MLARQVGGLALLASLHDVREITASVLKHAPDQAFLAGVITNIPEPSHFIRRDLPPPEQVEESFPVYEGELVLEDVRGFEDSHIQSALEGGAFDLSEAHDDEHLAREEYLSTLAIAGEIGKALRLLDDDFVGAERHIGPLMVACVESFRRGDTELSERVLKRVLDASCSCWEWLHLATGFLGRVPWGGYPYPDY